MKKTPKRAQRPIDVQDMPWSHMGKDALDGAAERVWNLLRHAIDADIEPYHIAPPHERDAAQRAVLDVIGHAVPAILRERAKTLKADGEDVYYLVDIADELETEHGGG
jgi:hypothetical protein